MKPLTLTLLILLSISAGRLEAAGLKTKDLGVYALDAGRSPVNLQWLSGTDFIIEAKPQSDWNTDANTHTRLYLYQHQTDSLTKVADNQRVVCFNSKNGKLVTVGLRGDSFKLFSEFALLGGRLELIKSSRDSSLTELCQSAGQKLALSDTNNYVYVSLDSGGDALIFPKPKGNPAKLFRADGRAYSVEVPVQSVLDIQYWPAAGGHEFRINGQRFLFEQVTATFAPLEPPELPEGHRSADAFNVNGGVLFTAIKHGGLKDGWYFWDKVSGKPEFLAPPTFNDYFNYAIAPNGCAAVVATKRFASLASVIDRPTINILKFCD